MQSRFVHLCRTFLTQFNCCFRISAPDPAILRDSLYNPVSFESRVATSSSLQTSFSSNNVARLQLKLGIGSAEPILEMRRMLATSKNLIISDRTLRVRRGGFWPSSLMPLFDDSNFWWGGGIRPPPTLTPIFQVA